MDIHKNTGKLLTKNSNAIHLNMLKPKDMNEKIDHSIMKRIIGTKRKHVGLGVMSEEFTGIFIRILVFRFCWMLDTARE